MLKIIQHEYYFSVDIIIVQGDFRHPVLFSCNLATSFSLTWVYFKKQKQLLCTDHVFLILCFTPGLPLVLYRVRFLKCYQGDNSKTVFFFFLKKNAIKSKWITLLLSFNSCNQLYFWDHHTQICHTLYNCVAYFRITLENNKKFD